MMHDHKERARRLGAEVVAAERPIVRRATGRCGDSCKWSGAHRLIARQASRGTLEYASAANRFAQH